jgi:hypothetical protein
VSDKEMIICTKQVNRKERCDWKERKGKGKDEFGTSNVRKLSYKFTSS